MQLLRSRKERVKMIPWAVILRAVKHSKAKRRMSRSLAQMQKQQHSSSKRACRYDELHISLNTSLTIGLPGSIRGLIPVP